MFTFKSKLFAFFILLALILSFAAAYVSGVISPMLRGRAESAIMVYIESCVAAALESAELERAPLDISYDENGRIASCTLDTTYTSRARAYISRALADALKGEISIELDARVGDITGLPFLYGRGARISCIFEAYGGISLDIKSEFCEAGINQTLHRSVLVLNTVFYIAAARRRKNRA